LRIVFFVCFFLFTLSSNAQGDPTNDKDGLSCLPKKKLNELLILAVKNTSSTTVAEIFIKKGASPNCVDAKGKSPLIYALENSDNKMIELLLLFGVNPNSHDSYGVTPLIRMVYYQNIEAIKLIIEYFVDINKFNSKQTMNPLMYAVQKNSYEVVELLIQSGAKIDITNKHGISPIMVAAQYNSLESAKLLIEAGADINAWTSNRMTPLMIATYADSYDVANLLNEFDATMNVPGAVVSVKRLPVTMEDMDKILEENAAQAKKERKEKNKAAIEYYALGLYNSGLSDKELLYAYFDKILEDLESGEQEKIDRAIVHLNNPEYKEVLDVLALYAPRFGFYNKIYRLLDGYISAVSIFEFKISNPLEVKRILDLKIRQINNSIRVYRGLK
jgi:ankyrin repeat protein